jgi:predicted O-methyltransferase YrrM
VAMALGNGFPSWRRSHHRDLRAIGLAGRLPRLSDSTLRIVHLAGHRRLPLAHGHQISARSQSARRDFCQLSDSHRHRAFPDRIHPHQPAFLLFGLSNAQAASLLSILIGAVLLWRIKSQFHSLKKEHRIVEHIAARGDVLQPEYHKPTAECPHPERWHMYDSMTAEVEVLDFLKAIVTTIKPELVVETGTFSGLSTLRIAEGLKANGLGRVITCEYDAKVFAAAKQRFANSGLSEWIDARNESSLEMKVDGRIDLLFCDSDAPIRGQEVRHFLPQINPYGLILMHDASSAMKTVREAALQLEQEGLVSVVLLPTPRGLVVAQKREGRK